MSTRHDRTVRAAHKAGAHAARRHARGEKVQAPDPMAGSLLARKAATAWHAGFAEVHGAAAGAESKAASGYDLTPRSGMISLDIPDGVIDPVPGGVEGPSHVTVAYLGKNVDNDAFDEACSRARDAASRIPGPLTASLSGIGSFPPDERGKTPVFIPASIPGGDRLRNDLADLSASQHPDWNPHVTLAYQDEGDEPPPPQPHKVVTFTHLSVHRGDDVRRFPFGGVDSATKRTSGMLETKVGPKGYVHGWHFLGVPGTGDTVHHPSHGKGIVTAVTDKHVSVRFTGSGAERTFEHSAPKAGKGSGFVKREDHEATATGKHAGHAAAARSLAADVRKSPVRSTLVSGRHYDTREMAASHLDEAAAHFDAGRESDALNMTGHARRVLADRASEGRSAVRGDAGRLKLDRSKDPTAATALAFRDESVGHHERAVALHQAATGIPGDHGASLSAGYLRNEGATDSDVAELARRYMVMHGKAPTAAEMAKIKRAKPPKAAAAPKHEPSPAEARNHALAKARSIHEADKAQGGGHLPPLALLGNEKHPDGSVSARAVDHAGRDYGVKLGADKTVTVTHGGKSLTEHGGTNPTQKARELAGKLTTPAAAVAKPDADDFWAHEQPKTPPPPPAPKPKFDQGAMFSEPDKLGTAPMFGDKFGTADVTKPNADAVAPATGHAAAARAIAAGVRSEPGLVRGQKDEAETRLYAAAKHLDAGNHAEAVRELDDVSHVAGIRGGGVIKGSTAAKARDLAAQVRTEHGIAPAKPAGSSEALSGDAAYEHVAEPAGKRERDAANSYSQGSARLNAPLRTGTNVIVPSANGLKPVVSTKADAATLRDLDSAFAKAPPTTRHIVAYRGTAAGLFGDGDATGTHFTDKGFTSTSADPGQAASFGSAKDHALMEIHIPAGSKVVKPGGAGRYSTEDDHEKELVLNRGGRYEITSDKMVDHPALGRIRKLTATYRGSS